MVLCSLAFLVPFLHFVLARQAERTHPDQIQHPSNRCNALSKYTGFQNTTVTSAIYYPEPVPRAVDVPSQCVAENLDGANVSVPLCRVQFVVNTTSTSQVKAEVWLPNEWHGRFLATGNAGLGGCISYGTLDYASSLHFAAVGSNNGHDGDPLDGESFYQQPEVVNDFTARSIHTISVVGKEIVRKYYSRPQDKSYYVGCSTGGRQGVYAALHYPEDFDGIVAGAPATNWNRLIGWMGSQYTHVGSTGDASFISQDQIKLVHQEVLRQCDSLDGRADGVISEPDDCNFDPEALLCGLNDSKNGIGCLTLPQVNTLKKVYSPLRDAEGGHLFPRYSPGAEFPFLGGYPADLPLVIPYTSSKIYYNLTSSTLGDTVNIDNFYRLFIVPGLDHCHGGVGPYKIGQMVNTIPTKNDSDHNVVLALVDWVEGGKSPESLIGTDDQDQEREICRYPIERSTWNGESYVCT